MLAVKVIGLDTVPVISPVPAFMLILAASSARNTISPVVLSARSDSVSVTTESERSPVVASVVSEAAVTPLREASPVVLLSAIFPEQVFAP